MSVKLSAFSQAAWSDPRGLFFVRRVCSHTLAARAPYFHNGSAATLEEVIEFYESRFQIGFTTQEKADILAFLRAL